MSDPVTDLTLWINKEFQCAKRDNFYLIDDGALDVLSEVLRNQLTSASYPDLQQDDMRELLAILLVHNRDERRALVANRIAIAASPIQVAGAVLGAAALVSLTMGGASPDALQTTLTVAGSLQGMASALSLLSPEERTVISLIGTSTRLNSNGPQTLSEVQSLAKAAGISDTDLARILSSLAQKGAIEWDHKNTGTIRLKKLF